MRARLRDLSFGMDGRQVLSLTVLDGDFREVWDELRDSELEVTVKKYRKRRSLDANAYFFVLADKVAAAMGTTKEEVYRHCIREIGGVSDTVCVRNEAVEHLREVWGQNGLGWQSETFPSKIEGCTNVVLYYGSSTYDTAQMARLIDNIIQDCKQLGIETATPDELADMLSLWESSGRRDAEHRTA